jgi:hypothetical protein
MMLRYGECHVVFDRYLEDSLKNKTREKRAATATEFEVHSEMNLTMTLKELLSSSKSKQQLSCVLAQGLLQQFSDDRDLKFYVVYGECIKGRNFEERHSHEEADTMIPHQVLASVSEGAYRDVFVWSPDTDVLILLLHLASSGRLGEQTGLKFLTGRGVKFRQIDVINRMKAIGIQKSQGLLGFHNFTGADWGGKFVGISKKTWVKAYMSLREGDPIVACFKELGGFATIADQLVDGNLPAEVQALERFVCQVYSPKGSTSIPALRWELFSSKNLEGENLPPTRSALLPHIQRANYMTMRDKSYQMNHPSLPPPIEQNGWTRENDTYLPLRCLSLPAPSAVIELRKCKCVTGCVVNCGCSKNGLPCTPLCKCYAGECGNKCRSPEHERDGE